MNTQEEWRQIAEFPRYQVSNLGRVRNRFWMVLAGGRHVDGYRNVSLKNRGSPALTRTIHRLVALAFLPRKKGKDVVNHLNGIRDDNRVENLEWTTIKGNIRHAISRGVKWGPKTYCPPPRQHKPATGPVRFIFSP